MLRALLLTVGVVASLVAVALVGLGIAMFGTNSQAFSGALFEVFAGFWAVVAAGVAVGCFAAVRRMSNKGNAPAEAIGEE